jgi:hypothetical protein
VRYLAAMTLRSRVASLVAVALACGHPATADVPRGPVRANGAAFADARGAFLPLGTTLFWAPWGYRHDRERLERELALLARSGVDYIRVLGQVGSDAGDDSWADRTIDPRWTKAGRCPAAPGATCPSYDEVIAGLTDLAFDRYGLRVEWTVFGSTGFTPTAASRRALVDRMLKMSNGREHKIIHFELANEFYHNGFEGAGGLEELRRLGRYMQDRTPILVALSASRSARCEPMQRLHAGGVGEVVTLHFERSERGPAGEWEPVRQPWLLQSCAGLPPLRTSNEPIGPFSSVNDESDPLRLALAAAVTYVSGVGAYVLHTGAGIRGGGKADRARGRPANIREVPRIDAIFRALRAVRERLPADVANWIRFDAAAANPIVSIQDPATVVGAYGTQRDGRFVIVPVGVRGALSLRAHASISLEIFDPRTGDRRAGRTLEAGETLTVAGPAGYLITGRITGAADGR